MKMDGMGWLVRREPPIWLGRAGGPVDIFAAAAGVGNPGVELNEAQPGKGCDHYFWHGIYWNLMARRWAARVTSGAAVKDSAGVLHQRQNRSIQRDTRCCSTVRAMQTASLRAWPFKLKMHAACLVLWAANLHALITWVAGMDGRSRSCLLEAPSFAPRACMSIWTHAIS